MNKKIKENVNNLSFLDKQELENLFYSNIFKDLRLQRYYDGYKQGQFDESVNNCFGGNLGGIDDDY